MWNTEVKQPNLLGPTHQSPLIISPLFVYLGCLGFFQEGILSQEFASNRMSLKTIFVSNKRHIFHFAKQNADCYWLQEWDLKFVKNNLLTPDKTSIVWSKRQKIWILLVFATLSYFQIFPVIWKPQGELSIDLMILIGDNVRSFWRVWDSLSLWLSAAWWDELGEFVWLTASFTFSVVSFWSSWATAVS